MLVETGLFHSQVLYLSTPIIAPPSQFLRILLHSDGTAFAGVSQLKRLLSETAVALLKCLDCQDFHAGASQPSQDNPMTSSRQVM